MEIVVEVVVQGVMAPHTRRFIMRILNASEQPGTVSHPAQGFANRYGIHPLIAFFTLCTDLMLFSGEAATFGVSLPLSLIVSSAVGYWQKHVWTYWRRSIRKMRRNAPSLAGPDIQQYLLSQHAGARRTDAELFQHPQQHFLQRDRFGSLRQSFGQPDAGKYQWQYVSRCDADDWFSCY